MRIFQSIAAGILGKAAFTGGLRTEALGVALHYFILLMIVVVYWTVSRWLPLLVKRPFVCGPTYGVLVYLVMGYVVIPLSATTRTRFLLSWVVCSVIVHAFVIGVSAAWFARKAS